MEGADFASYTHFELHLAQSTTGQAQPDSPDPAFESARKDARIQTVTHLNSQLVR